MIPLKAQPFRVSIGVGIFLPILLWLAFTPFSAWLDLEASRAFHHGGSFTSHPFWDWIYRFGILPAWILVGFALTGFFLSFRPSFYNLRKPCLYLMLTLLIGSGLFVHAALKEQWGRPRPKQIEEFGGNLPFRPYYQPNFEKGIPPSKSFTSGHASVGFYFFSIALLGSVYRSRLLFWLGMGLAWGLGSLLSIARLAQGGHFLSDTLASALIMWLTSWGLAYLFFSKGDMNERVDP